MENREEKNSYQPQHSKDVRQDRKNIPQQEKDKFGEKEENKPLPDAGDEEDPGQDMENESSTHINPAR